MGRWSSVSLALASTDVYCAPTEAQHCSKGCKAVPGPSVAANSWSANFLLSVEALPITLPTSHPISLPWGQSSPLVPNPTHPTPCRQAGNSLGVCASAHWLRLSSWVFVGILQREQQTYTRESKQCSLKSPECRFTLQLCPDKRQRRECACNSHFKSVQHCRSLLTPESLSCDCALDVTLLFLCDPVCTVLTQPGHGVPFIFVLFPVHVLQWNFECLHVDFCRPSLHYPPPFLANCVGLYGLCLLRIIFWSKASSSVQSSILQLTLSLPCFLSTWVPGHWAGPTPYCFALRRNHRVVYCWMLDLVQRRPKSVIFSSTHHKTCTFWEPCPLFPLLF